jgi:SurA N-terminal domain
MLSNTTGWRTRHRLAAAVAVALLGLTACGGDGEGSSESAPKSAEEQKKDGEGTTGNSPDLASVPDVVATVNGEEIGKGEFTPIYEIQFKQMSMQAQSTGQPVDEKQLKDQVVQNLIGTELLVQEADRREIAATDAETDRALKGLAQQNQLGSVDELFNVFEQQGMDRELVESQVRDQVKVEQLVSDEAGDLKVSEKEARALYDQMKAQQQAQGGAAQQQVPPFRQVKDQLVGQVKSQKESQVAQRLVSGLREEADVVVNL